MNGVTGVYMRGIEHLSPEERHRLRRARQICGQVADDVGVEIEAIEQVAACADCVHGHGEEAELWEKARAELERRRAG
jgi:response regulator RpfG family c-di-GMP phosphodiesterase